MTKERLPGPFKVVRLNYTINNNVYDPTAVSLLIPSGAIIEPNSEDGSCCILFSGKDSESRNGNRKGSGSGSDDSNLPIDSTDTTNITAVIESLSRIFPQWKNDCYDDIANQLNRTTTATTTTNSTMTTTTTTTTTTSTTTTSSSSSSSSYSVTCHTYHHCDAALMLPEVCPDKV